MSSNRGLIHTIGLLYMGIFVGNIAALMMSGKVRKAFWKRELAAPIPARTSLYHLAGVLGIFLMNRALRRREEPTGSGMADYVTVPSGLGSYVTAKGERMFT